MKLCTFEVKTPCGPLTRLGALLEGKILDLNLGYATYLHRVKKDEACYELSQIRLPPSMLELFKDWELRKDFAEITLDFVREELSKGKEPVGPMGERLLYPEGEVKLKAPIPRPTSIRDFLSFEKHAESKRGPKPKDWYEIPVYYKGNPDSVMGHEDEIPWPSYTELLDYELEYGIYILRKGKNIPVELASEYIAGFTIFNDVSARDIPEGFYLGPAKQKDFCNIMGPYLVTPDELDPYNLRMVSRINGETWSDGSSRTMYWKWEELVHFASLEETLMPGDFLGSGTIEGGCGLDHGRWIKPGDVIELEVEKIGVLRNRVGEKPERRSLRLRKK